VPKQQIADFCGTNTHTVSDWFFRNITLPQGDTLLKLYWFLNLNGYQVLELERMKPACRNVTQLIGFGVISSTDAIGFFGYAKEATLMGVLKGDTGLTKDREHQFWEAWKDRKDTLDEAIEKAQKSFRIRFGVDRGKVSIPEKVEEPSASVAPKSESCPRVGTILIMQGLLNLLDGGVMENLSASDLAKLGKSNVTILRLSSHLSDLSAKLLKSG
jgi:hypothetical protein